MSRKYFYISAALLVSLFIYLFYRTNHTLVNGIAVRLLSAETFGAMKAHVVNALPLNKIIIYSLPEGLWVFCITLTSKPYYIGLGRWRVAGKYIPLVSAIGLELLQLVHIANGRFDWMDIALSVAGWLAAVYLVTGEDEPQNFLSRPNLKSMTCAASYCIVYLAHVLK